MKLRNVSCWNIKFLLMASQGWGCSAGLGLDASHQSSTAQTVLPWSKSLAGPWPINTWKCLHLRCSQHVTRPQCLPKYRVVGLGCLVVSSHKAQIFLSFPHPHRTAALEYLWFTEKKAELTWLLNMMLSHRIEKRPFCCASNLWETRAAQCKGLGNFSILFDTRPVRFVCNLVWQWLP